MKTRNRMMAIAAGSAILSFAAASSFAAVTDNTVPSTPATSPAISGAPSAEGGITSQNQNSATNNANMPQPINANPGGNENTANHSSGSTSPPSNQTATAANADQIVADISIANIALNYGMKEDALTHIGAARQVIGQLNNASLSTPVNAGKLSYKTSKGEMVTLIPVVNERFVARQLYGSHLNSKNPDIDVADAESVHYKVFLDTHMADEQLADAQTALGQNNDDKAMNDLQNISQSAFSETLVQEAPLESARDNLIVAHGLLDEQDYRGASFALKHADLQLGQAEKQTPSLANDSDIKNMRTQIHDLQKNITKENPSMLQKANQKIDDWIKDVKSKISTI